MTETDRETLLRIAEAMENLSYHLQQVPPVIGHLHGLNHHAAELRALASRTPEGTAEHVYKPGVCGVDGYWCHGTCARHGQCMYWTPQSVEGRVTT